MAQFLALLGSFDLERGKIVNDCDESINHKSFGLANKVHLLPSCVCRFALISCSCLHTELCFIDFKKLDIRALLIRSCNKSCNKHNRLQITKITIPLKVLQVSNLIVLICLILVKHGLIELPLNLHGPPDGLKTLLFLFDRDLFLDILFGSHMHVELLLNLSEMAFECVVEKVYNSAWLLHDFLHLLPNGSQVFEF